MLKDYKPFVITYLVIAFISCFSLSTSYAQPSPNILVIVADDLGVDASQGYMQSPVMPTTPHLDDLRANGLTFKNVWAAPKCSPSRAAIMSGKYGVKNGVLGTPGNLSTVHTSIFNELDALTGGAYANAVIGKWHISAPPDFSHPAQHGIDYYEGLFGAEVSDYYNWTRVINGVSDTVTEYVTTHLTNSAINWVNAQTQPWFLWLAHAAPHSPFHIPPDSMYTRNNVTTNKMKYMAAIEAMDFDIGRLLDNIPSNVLDNTIIIFLGDNGTPSGVIQNYLGSQGKGSLYQGGVHVPMIVKGVGVSRINEEETALVHVADVFATLLDLAGANLPGGMHNSLSFEHLLSGTSGPTRPHNYIDLESGAASGWAIRDAQYKLIEFATEVQEFYDLMADPLETTNLIGNLTTNQQTIKANFEAEASVIRNGWSCQDLIQNGNETGIDLCTPIVCTNSNSTSTTNIGCCATPAFPNVYNETLFNDVRYINTNNFPNHDYCYNPNRQPSPIVFQFQTDASPTLAASPTSILTATFRPDRHFGVGLNGVVMSPAPATPFIFENPDTGEYNWDWVFEPTNNQGSGMDKVGLDCASAHTNGQGVYHYHGNMFEFAELIRPGISTLNGSPPSPVQIGWASDGFPILYRFAPDGSGGLALLQPSYQVKQGERPGDGTSAPCGPYNGKYTNDYMYMPGSGDLDECNGISRTVVLPTAQGMETFDYFYVITDSFPQIPRCMSGTPDETFNNSNNGLMVNVSLEAKVMLEGPFLNGLMQTDLRTLNAFPTFEPYSALGFESAWGTEVIDPAVLAITGPKSVVDWVFVELRHELNSSSVLYGRSGLVLRDGSIVDVDGVSPLQFSYTPPGNYFVAIHHRNHLSIMTQGSMAFMNGVTTTLDFTVATTPVYGTDTRKEVNGVYMLWAGDASADGLIDALDRGETWNARNTTGYLLPDVNMDGIVDALDRGLTWNNRNKASSLP